MTTNPLDALEAIAHKEKWTPRLCPVCGQLERLTGNVTSDGRVIATCFDAVQLEDWLPLRAGRLPR